MPFYPLPKIIYPFINLLVNKQDSTFQKELISDTAKEKINTMHGTGFFEHSALEIEIKKYTSRRKMSQQMDL